MRFSNYAVLDDGYNNSIGSPASVPIGPSAPFDGYNDGYQTSTSFTTKPIDLGQINQFGALCSFLTGSTLAGTLALQVCDDDPGPNAGNSGAPDVRFANWLTLTNANVSGSQIVAAATIVSGAVVVPFEYSLPGHRFIRFVFTRSSGTGVVSFAYTVKRV